MRDRLKFRKPDLDSRDSAGFYTSSGIQATSWVEARDI
jgi:hypothetical protein